MPSYFLTNKAVEDLRDIWNYTCNRWSEEQADRYYLALADEFSAIVKATSSGRSYAGISRQLRGTKVNSHVVFYRSLEGGLVEITRILHSRMDLKSRIAE
jgi:toxin ParE1/3/4